MFLKFLGENYPVISIDCETNSDISPVVSDISPVVSDISPGAIRTFCRGHSDVSPALLK